ncbi:MAG TPA: ribonuclease HIII [Opitutales bacterium]|jgi:ribonuclease HIII|nr:ribonuclease HIII [Opitutales bacterium]
MFTRQKPADGDDKKTRRTSYTITLTAEQMDKLKAWCDHRMWSFFAVEHARFAFAGDNVNVVCYNSGKCVIAGKKTEDFVTYVLENEITGDPRLGYDEVHHPDWFEPHAGLDESGKGDLFGPLVSACVSVGHDEAARAWMEAGVKDSKAISSDSVVLRLDKLIRATRGVSVQTVVPGMRKYNELYLKFGSNLNKLLAWYHARGLEAALKQQPVPWALLDQFTKQPLVQRSLRDVPKPFELRMRTKAESDPVVAAASIVARAEFVRQMQTLSEMAGEELRKGASAEVKAQAKRLIQKFGPDALGDFAKLHFRTAYEALGLPVPEKKAWIKYGSKKTPVNDE